MSLPEISRRCVSCGASVRAGARYCPQCGKVVPEGAGASDAESRGPAVPSTREFYAAAALFVLFLVLLFLSTTVLR